MKRRQLLLAFALTSGLLGCTKTNPDPCAEAMLIQFSYAQMLSPEPLIGGEGRIKYRVKDDSVGTKLEIFKNVVVIINADILPVYAEIKASGKTFPPISKSVYGLKYKFEYRFANTDEIKIIDDQSVKNTYDDLTDTQLKNLRYIYITKICSPLI